MLSRRLLTFSAVCLLAPAAAAQDTPRAALKTGVRVAVVGDSITEQKLYSKYIADYLYACQPQLAAHVVQFGWGGERAGGFAARLDNDVMPFKPDLVTICYGMNDGGYTKYRQDIGDAFQKPMADAVTRLKKAGATVIVGSPGAVDQMFFKRKKDEATSAEAEIYNDNLAHLRDISKTLAAKNGFPFANVHDAMKVSMVAAQKALGDKYPVCGGDGFHPAPNGQLVMAYAFLKAMQLDGDLGTITIDCGGESTAVNGHKVLKSDAGKVEVESSRYPFAFFGGEKDANGTRSITPYLPFNADLNRLTLVVKNAPGEKLKVTWGKGSKSYTKAELEKGVNIAADFADHPLVAPFMKVDALVADQQNFQTTIIKGVITNHRQVIALDAGLATPLGVVRDRLWELEAAKDAAVKKAVVPVTHTITVAAE